MSVQEHLSLIERNFSYLFNELGFRVIYEKEFRLDHNSIGLESDFLKLLFEQERGGFGIFVGTLDSSFDDKKSGWVNLYSLMAYLLKKELDWSMLNKSPYSEQTNIMFSITAKEFAPLCKQVIEMFRSPEIVAQWKPKYEQYVKDKTQKLFGKM